jgi:23S rRNA (cytosine1962-C5)-methyltransferase
MTSLATVTLAPGREPPFQGGHPWVFSGAIASVAGAPADGDEVAVRASDGSFIARGLFNGRSQIRVRLYRWDDDALDASFFDERVRQAVSLRYGILGLGDDHGACRLVFSEGDGLSGVTVDRYGVHLAVQFTSLALASRRDVILDALEGAVSPRSMVLRTEKGILEEEGLELRDGPLRGEVPQAPVEILEAGLRFAVDLRTGQKTGFYLDQRENRRRAAAYADGRVVADVCCYTGGFSIPLAAAGAASVTGVDASAAALELAAENAGRNGVADRISFARGDAFRWLEGEAAAGRRYGMIVLDPPRFARTRKGVRQALQAYHRLNRLALECLEADGILVTCSCSGRVTDDEFAGAVGRAGASARRRVQILESRGQAPDHPVSASCPESAYLKCLICRVT